MYSKKFRTKSWAFILAVILCVQPLLAVAAETGQEHGSGAFGDSGEGALISLPPEMQLPAEAWDEPQMENGGFEAVFWGAALLNSIPLRRNRTETVGTEPRNISEHISLTPKVWINGRPYEEDKWGNIEAVVGQSFSYSVEWTTKGLSSGDSGLKIGKGDYFEKTIFKIPGLSLHSNLYAQKMIIDGIHIGNWDLTYDKDGNLKFKGIFNRYVGFFDSNSIIGVLRGNGKFANKVGPDADTILGSEEGTITVTLPVLPDKPDPPPAGTGWKPSTAPVFKATPRPFGKGLKWNSSPDTPLAEPWMEWRVVFF